MPVDRAKLQEAILREQMAAIKKELGETEDDGKSQEVAELTKAIDAARLPPEEESVIQLLVVMPDEEATQLAESGPRLEITKPCSGGE